MSDNKLKVKHLLENNTRESISGEMIISHVTGHISVRDKYFVNSATKDIIGRINALNQFYDYLNNNDVNIKKLEEDSLKYSEIFSIYNESIGNEDFIERYTDTLEEYLDKSNDNNKTPMQYYKSEANTQKTNVKLRVYSREDILYELAEVEKTLTETELLYEKLHNMEQYLLEQEFMYERYLEELIEDFEVTKINYEELCDRYLTYSNYMTAKYESLIREFNCSKIQFKGGVLDGKVQIHTSKI